VLTSELSIVQELAEVENIPLSRSATLDHSHNMSAAATRFSEIHDALGFIDLLQTQVSEEITEGMLDQSHSVITNLHPKLRSKAKFPLL
jgi:hypothetical protein